MTAHTPDRTLQPDPVDVLVVGGGLAGLTAACTAAGDRPGSRVLLLDGHPLGGRARVDERDGYVFNRGPRALYEAGPARRILADLGVDVASGGPPSTQGSSALEGGRFHALPAGPASLLATTLLTPAEKAGFARASRLITRLDPGTYAGRPLHELVADLRATGTTAALFHALVRVGTYVHAPAHLDAGAALAQVQLALRGVRYLDGGWQSIVDTLARTAAERGVEIRSGATVRAVRPASGGGDPAPVVVTTDAGELQAHRVVLAAGSPETSARLLGGRPAGWQALGPPATVSCLELGVRRPPPTRFVLGIDEPLYLSVHAPPARLAPAGGAVVHLMRYHQPDEAVDPARARADLHRLAEAAGITAGDVAVERFLGRMTVTGALPTCGSGGLAGRPPAESADHPGVLLAGDWVGPEGMLADAAVASGARAGHRAAAPSGTMAGV